MIDILKNWIATILCVGIFFTFIQMVVPNTKLKKYIYSLIGVVTLIALMLPFANKISLNSIEDATIDVLNNIGLTTSNDASLKDGKNNIDNNIKSEMTKKIKDDLKSKLLDHGIKSEMVSVILDDKYTIQKINIKILKQNNSNLNMNTIFGIIKENYGISNENVIIEEV